MRSYDGNLVNRGLKLSKTISIEEHQIIAGDFTIPVVKNNDTEYFSVPENRATIVSKVNVEDLEFAIKAIATNNYRLELNGMLFDGKKKKIVSTDSVRLHISDANWFKEDKSYIVQKRCLDLVLLVFKGKEVSIEFWNGYVFFSHGETVLYSKLINGNYPAWENILPDKTKFTPNIDFTNLDSHHKGITPKTVDYKHI